MVRFQFGSCKSLVLILFPLLGRSKKHWFFFKTPHGLWPAMSRYRKLFRDAWQTFGRGAEVAGRFSRWTIGFETNRSNFQISFRLLPWKNIMFQWNNHPIWMTSWLPGYLVPSQWFHVKNGIPLWTKDSWSRCPGWRPLGVWVEMTPSRWRSLVFDEPSKGEQMACK